MASERRHSFTAPVWEHDGPGAWYFVALPEGTADLVAGAPPGSPFGSLRVVATIGATQWRTSIFPDRRRGTYLLPVKKAVRRAEGLEDGTVVHVELVVE